MGLRIQNNISALNAHRNLTVADSAMAKSLERLSSGYRINRAADDAAGLSISRAFRADIASFKMASRNASEASALLNVAEGASNQISNMLVRLKELATQGASANAEANLAKIDAERAKLISEIDKIAASTEYADSKLINGTYGVAVSSTGTNVVDSYGYESISGMKAGHTYVINVVATTSSVADIRLEEWDSTDGTLKASQEIYDTAIPGSGATTAVEFGALGVTLTINDNLDPTLAEGAQDYIVASTGGSSTFQLGAETDSSNRIDVTLGSLTTTSLGINSISLATSAGALSAMSTIDTAIGTLNTVTGDIGAASNQLMYHAANLASTVENIQAAESVIRDVDMAAEMVEFTKNQILLQAGTAMLAQANMAPQQVLALFG